MSVENHLGLLGKKCKDKITGIEGPVISISFDLYGCVQGMMHTGTKEDGSLKDSFWMDITRLEVIDQTPVMKAPNFNEGYVAEGKKGPADKPTL